MKTYLVQLFLNRLCFYEDRSWQIPTESYLSDPFSLGFPFLLYFWQWKTQVPDGCSFQKTLRDNNTALSTPHSSTRDAEWEHWRRQFALSAGTASQSQTPHWHLLALLKIYPWKDTGLSVTTPAGYPGDLLRCLNLRVHTPNYPNGCI